MLNDLTLFDKESFSKYNNSISNRDISTSQSQDVADKTFAIKAQFENINQYMFNCADATMSPEVYKDIKIDHLFTNFMDDLKNIDSNLLILIQFGIKGFNGFSEEFRIWFKKEFLQEIIYNNIKICIINQEYLSNEFYGISNKYQVNVGDIDLDDAKREAEKHIREHDGFCHAIVDSKTKTVPYFIFKSKLIDYYKKCNLKLNI